MSNMDIETLPPGFNPEVWADGWEPYGSTKTMIYKRFNRDHLRVRVLWRGTKYEMFEVEACFALGRWRFNTQQEAAWFANRYIKTGVPHATCSSVILSGSVRLHINARHSMSLL